MRYTLQQQLTAQGYVLVNRYFDEARRQIALLTGREDIDLTKPVRWADFSPSVRKRVEAVYTSLFRQLKVLTAKTLNEAGSHSAHALLQTEAIKPLDTGQHRLPELSKRIWAYVGQEKNSMELTLTRVLRERTNASDAVHLFTKYLNLPDEMLRYLAGEGDPALTQRAMQILNPGAGVYRDPVKNVLRLIKTEINRATKTADWERMQASPYITGYRIKRSTRYHTAKAQGKKMLECELCSQLTGEYPKTFKFTGWHPNCECIVEPIFVSDPAERKRIRQAQRAGKAYTPNGTIRELPRGLQAVYHRLSPRNRSVVDTALKPYRKEQYKLLKAEAVDLYKDKTLQVQGIDKPINISTRGIKEWLNQPFEQFEAKNRAILHLDKLLSKGEYLGYIEDRHDANAKAHLIEVEIAQKQGWIIVRELHNGECFLYSITDSPTMKEML